MHGATTDVTYYFIVLLIGSTCYGHTKKKTHHIQGNTMITTHKGSQLLKLIETRYQVQSSNKELHTEHIPLRTIILR